MADRSRPSREPPDGGWGWVIVMAIFISFTLTTGLIYSFGVLYVALLDAFGESKAKTAWVGSVLGITFAWTNSLGVALARKIGHRKTVMLGGFLVFTGLITSSFAIHLVMLYFTYGVIAGTGCGLVYSTGIEFVSMHFKERLTIALGIALAGTGAGQFALSLVTQYLIDIYGWRGSLLILSAVTLNICAAGTLMWPLKRGKQSNSKEQKNETGIEDRRCQIIAPKSETIVNPGKDDRRSQILEGVDKNTESTSDERKEPHNCNANETDCQSKDAVSRWRFSCRSCLSVIFDLSLFYEPVSWVIIFVTIGQTLANATVLVHMVRRARDFGISDAYSALIPAVMGLTQMVTRPLWGAIGHIHGVRANIPYGTALVICAISIIISIYTRTFAGQAIFIVVYGLCNGGYMVFIPIVVASFLGPEKIGYGTSLSYQVLGLISLPASPLAGWIRDETGVYDWAFWMAGISVLLAAVLAFLLPVIEKVVKRKRPQRKSTYMEETDVTNAD